VREKASFLPRISWTRSIEKADWSGAELYPIALTIWPWRFRTAVALSKDKPEGCDAPRDFDTNNPPGPESAKERHHCYPKTTAQHTGLTARLKQPMLR